MLVHVPDCWALQVSGHWFNFRAFSASDLDVPSGCLGGGIYFSNLCGEPLALVSALLGQCHHGSAALGGQLWTHAFSERESTSRLSLLGRVRNGQVSHHLSLVYFYESPAY